MDLSLILTLNPGFLSTAALHPVVASCYQGQNSHDTQDDLAAHAIMPAATRSRTNLQPLAANEPLAVSVVRAVKVHLAVNASNSTLPTRQPCRSSADSHSALTGSGHRTANRVVVVCRSNPSLRTTSRSLPPHSLQRRRAMCTLALPLLPPGVAGKSRPVYAAHRLAISRSLSHLLQHLLMIRTAAGVRVVVRR
jgi:hypothetical protein